MADTTETDDAQTGAPGSRRGLLRAALAGVAALIVGGAAVGLGGSFLARLRGGGKQIAVPVAALPKPGADPLVNRDGKLWMITDPDGVLALSWACPHAGCIVPWNEGEKRFHCPCHNSTFDRQGVCTGGPAPRPLDLYGVSVAGGVLTIDTGVLTQRQGYEPSQATRLPG